MKTAVAHCDLAKRVVMIRKQQVLRAEGYLHAGIKGVQASGGGIEGSPKLRCGPLHCACLLRSSPAGMYHQAT